MVTRISEQETRYSLIDPELKKAWWNIADRSQVGLEIPVDKYDSKPAEGVTDYCLYRANGDVLAVIEAKRTRRDARVGKQQVFEYVTKIGKQQSFRPFAFMANGSDIYFWDTDESAERLVAGFFSRENLERLLFIKQNRVPLNTVKIKTSIVDRAYQAEAIRRICESVELKKKRKALLVMATGTGKTRTIMGLIDVFLQAKRAQKVLFLVDRDALVNQALNDGFKVHLTDESRTRVRSYAIDKNARVYVSTLQTLETCYAQFTPADFDLIVSDECHRSIYNKYTDVLAYFDAVQIGLTATPAEFIDRDTFKFFDCDGRSPTYLYTYDKAVEEKYLAEYNVYAAQTKFQRKGIKSIDLSEEDQESLRRRGLDPENINYEGTDLERKVTNADTLRRQWEEFMDVCIKDATGQLPGKTIVFAVTHDHALRLADTFNQMYPEHGGKLIQVIDSKMERADVLLEQFKKQNLPRIAISVDMLDTGVDIPEIVNLAFMKPVNSQIKFWQMIGRGTRHHSACRNYNWLPNELKEMFLIVDFWENFDHFQMMPSEDQTVSQIPVRVTIFNTRLNKLEWLLGDQSSDDFRRIIKDLRNDIAKIPLESFTVKKQYQEISDAWADDYWKYITAEKIVFLRMKVGPLLRYAMGNNPAELFFISKMERCGLSFLQHKDLKAHIESIRDDVDLLPSSISEVAAREQIKNDILTDTFWKQVTLEKIDTAKEALSPLMKFKNDKPSIVIELGLDDIIESRKWVLLKNQSERIYVEEYRKRVEEKILALADKLPAIQKLKRDEPVSIADLEAIENTLTHELSADEIGLDEENMLKAFGVRAGNLVDFLKHVLKIDFLPTYERIVRRAFDAFILEHNYNADQSRFLRTVQSVFMQRKKIDLADLYEEPFTNLGVNAVEKLFSEIEINELLELTKKLVA